MHDRTPATTIVRIPVSRLDAIRYFDGTCRCTDSKCICHEAMATVAESERIPIVRVPTTQKHLACVLSGKFVCTDKKCLCHQAEVHFADVFYSSISNLVFLLANKYSTSCIGDVKDLSQICMKRIIQNLHMYNPEFAVSTFVWHVCKNILNREVKETSHHRSVFEDVPLDDHIDIGKRDEYSFLSLEISDAVREIRREHPSWEDVLVAIFGDVDSEINCIPDDFCVARVAKKTHRRYNEIQLFVKTVVRPFFVQRFKNMET